MTNPGPTKEEYDSLIYKLAKLKSELKQAQKLLEAPARRAWWRRLWGMGAKAAVVILVMVMVGGAGADSGRFGVYEWNRLESHEKVLYVMGYGSGLAAGAACQAVDPKLIPKLFACMDNWSYGQSVAIIDKYLRENPHKWDKHFSRLVWDSQIDACKKRGSLP